MSKAQELADGQSEAQMIAGWLESGGGHGVPSMHALRAARELRRLDRVNAGLREALNSTNAALEKIGDYAHDRSTGPAVWDPLWEIRSMAYDNVFCVDAALSSSGGTES